MPVWEMLVLLDPPPAIRALTPEERERLLASAHSQPLGEVTTQRILAQSVDLLL